MAIDPHWSSVVSLLHLDGEVGSTTIVDEKGRAWNNDAFPSVQLSADQPAFGATGGLWSQSGSALRSENTDGAFNFTDQPFTLEASVYPPSLTANAGLFTRRIGAVYCPFEFRLNVSGFIEVLMSTPDNSTWFAISTFAGVSVIAGQQNHVAIVGTGSELQVYIRGVKSSTTVSYTSIASTSAPMYIGRGGDGGYGGYIDEVRITKGVARYTADFTPPTSAHPGEFDVNAESSAYAPTPLSSAFVVAAVAVISSALVASPLGEPTASASVPITARSSAPSVIGPASAKVALLSNARSVATSPLGGVSALSAASSASASAGSPLSPAVVRAVMGGRAIGSAPAVLGASSALIGHDFTVALGDVTARYVMDLVTDGGLVRVPISSWQATLQTGAKCYVQAVIPATTQYADAINTASEFVISRAAVLPSGMQVVQEMARSPVGSAQFDRGAMRETCTISGYADGFAESINPPAEYDRTLSRIRSMSSGAGGMRVRCAVDWLLRPGQRAFADGVPMIADYINYYAPTGGDSYMDVGERA